MKQLSGFLLTFFLFISFTAFSQGNGRPMAGLNGKKAAPAAQKPRSEKEWLEAQIDSLTSPRMHGRGYVNGGKDSAAKYLLREFHELRLKPVDKENSFCQSFAFPVNTFPGKISLVIDDTKLQPGVDYIVDGASPSYSGENVDVKKVNLAKIKDEKELKEQIAAFDSKSVYCLEYLSELCKLLHIRKSEVLSQLPQGCYLVPEERKLMWNVSRETMPATVFYIKESAVPKKMKTVSATVNATFEQHMNGVNLVGSVPGVIKDSYIVFTAHYDHLGMMGDSVVFPGASDNASGVAMMLSLASYFSKNPQRYSLLFIAFAGEEASLMGSEFFVWHPLVPLQSIKFLTNLDIMGDATDGISVVNGTAYPQQMAVLQKLNAENNYVPKIYPKGPAANGDHYHFVESGVPAIYIYSNGGHGFYHDVYDAPDALTLTNVSGVAKLLINFVKEF